MSLMQETKCLNCGIPFMALGVQSLCPKCRKNKATQEKIDWVAERRYDEKNNREKTLEERINWIEEWIYENKEIIAKKSIQDNVPF